MGSGTYFAVDADFWTDPDIVDNFTPEDKYFYLYLLTSIHGNVAGCFQISTKQMADELGYSRDTVEHLIERFVSVHRMIDYSKENKEILIHKWGRHHWTKSDKYLTAVRKKIDAIKTEKFKEYLSCVFDRFLNGDDTVWIPYQYGTDTSFLYYSFNDSLSIKDDIKEDREGTGEKEGKKESADSMADVVAEWNMAGFKPVERISPASKRGEMTRKRLNDYGKEKVIEAIRRASGSDFLHGENDRGWAATFDWFIRPENFQKVLEGNYDNRGVKGRSFADMYWEEINGKDGRFEAVDVT